MHLCLAKVDSGRIATVFQRLNEEKVKDMVVGVQDYILARASIMITRFIRTILAYVRHRGFSHQLLSAAWS